MEPDTAGLEHDELATPEGDIYMRRWWITRHRNGASERFHHILLPDPDPDLHDHPWNFDTHLIHGTYTEHTPHGRTIHPEGTRLHREATDAHRLHLETPVWTHVTTGPVTRTWGFHTPNGWVDWRTYKGKPRPPQRWHW